MQENKKNTIQNVLTFAEEKGFYIILGLCIVAIGVSGYVLFFSEPANTPGDILMNDTLPQISTQPVTDVTIPPQTDAPDVKVDSTQPIEVPVVSTTQVPEIPRRETTTPAVQAANTMPPAKDDSIVMPVKGEVARPFSGQDLIYDETMGDWRTHKGVDILCSVGDEVVSMAAGSVSGVFTDPMLGNCVTVASDDGLVTTYCGLDVNKTMKVGTKLGSGDAIGTAGNTVLAESAQECHIHVEMTKDGVHIDPLSVINK